MKQLRLLTRRTSALLLSLVLLFWLSIPLLVPNKAQAAQLQSRSLKLSSSANGSVTTNIAGVAAAAGSGGNGQKTSELFTFTLQTTQNVGSVLIVYCDNPIPEDPCTTPTGFDASNVSAVTQGGAWDPTAFTTDTSTNLTAQNCDNARVRCIAIKRGSAVSESSGDIVTLTFGGTSTDYITNPTTDNYAFFARITTYSDTAWTAANKVDYGTVAGSTAQQIDITAKVKEVLNFSVSPTAAVARGSTCTPLTDPNNGALKLGDVNGVLSFSTAYDAHSYFRLSTNTNGGVKVYYSGDTLKNGTNSIAAIGTTAATSSVGSPQFGLAIDDQDLVGTEPNNFGYHFANMVASTAATPGPTNYSNGAGSISNPGATALFAFDTASVNTPVELARASGPVTCDTGSVRYIGNISTATPAGIYTTTITYIATGVY